MQTNEKRVKKGIFLPLLVFSMIILLIGPTFPFASACAHDESSYEMPLDFALSRARVRNGENRRTNYIPDLTVSHVTFDPSSPTEGETLAISAMIQNIGRRSAYNIKVGFYNGDLHSDGTSIGFVKIRRLRARRSTVVTTSWTTEAGVQNIYVMADPDNTITESNENNNIDHSPIATTTVTTIISKVSDPPVPPVMVSHSKWAVLIGISDYKGTESDLWNPHKDALDMNRILVNVYGFPKENIMILLNERATMNSILAAIDWLNSVEDSSDDIVVFFFSGHGKQISERDRRWRNADKDREADGKDEFIVSYDLSTYADGFLAKKFAAFDSDNLFLWFSCCYSGGMDDIYKTPGFSGVICASCKENQYGFDVRIFENSLFGEFYIDRGIIRTYADTNRDAIITVEEAHYYATPLVAAWAIEKTGYHSEPQIFDSDPYNDFYL